MKTKKTYHINNLEISYGWYHGTWSIKSPDGVVLEEKKLLKDAKEWASKTTDFIDKK